MNRQSFRKKYRRIRALSGRTVKELNDEEIKALDESIPFKFERPEVEETTDEQAPAEEAK